MNELMVDLNCDVAEGIGNEKELMPWISSANIACGFHAGNEELMKATVDLCLLHNVAIGAHPSFLDRANFGRTSMTLPLNQIIDLVSAQIELLKKITDQCGARLHHVKPHGALYNMAARDNAIANGIATAIKRIDGSIILYGLSQSAMIEEGIKANLKVANEVFADRTYQPDGSLTPRTQPHALITDEQEATAQAVGLVREHKVMTVSGTYIRLKADTLCLHGDGSHAVAFAQLIHTAFERDGIRIKSY